MQKCIEICNNQLHTYKRVSTTEDIIKEFDDQVEIVLFQEESKDSFENGLAKIIGSSSILHSLKKRFTAYTLSTATVVILLFALLSSSIFEDISKKLLFETPFDWGYADYLSMLFVLIFFLGLVAMPSILEGEGSQLKEFLKAWFNKDARQLKRLQNNIKELDASKELHCYNFDIFDVSHWSYKLLLPCVCKHFNRVVFYVRNDQRKTFKKELEQLGFDNVILKDEIKLKKDVSKTICLFSAKESLLFNLLQLCSTQSVPTNVQTYISLELFEYCSRNFISNQFNTNTGYGFQNFINRSFDDFGLLQENNSKQIELLYTQANQNLTDEIKRLSYFLRNHIEECVQQFENPISLLILYYYVKDIVIDKRRSLLILEKFIHAIKKFQQYEFISKYWFDIAGEMFESNTLESFETSSNSVYRKLSLETLNTLMFLFERSGHFKQALLLAQYLYEINPKRYAIDISSLNERMGYFDEAFKALPTSIKANTTQPLALEVRFHQRKSWMIVSQRKEELKNEGLEALEQLHTLLFSHIEDNEALWLWNYYNIKANYFEWEKEYDQAIEYYQKCLSIPTLGAFEYGATFVNMAIAYRFKFIQSNFKASDSIEKAIKFGELGIRLKNEVGDRDEMPVVLHNQALNILYSQTHTSCNEKLQEVLKLTNDAIEILDSTSSVKRLGIILFENILAQRLLSETHTELEQRLRDYFPNISEYEKEQIQELQEVYLQHSKINTNILQQLQLT